MTTAPRPELPGEGTRTRRRAAMLRVDHAGEHGAVRIYEGQLAVLGTRPATARSAALIRDMAEQEASHLKTFDELLTAEGVRPTLLAPVWHMAGFALGAASALMGERAAMACTAAVESAIDDHYAAQAAELEAQDAPLKRTIERFRDDEIAHRETALKEGAEAAPAYPLLSAAIKAGCRLAIRLSERF
ncbi:MAG: demethoxyubiquinone hydroxylase family protein [Alphaproteobacteria bacterium]|nr:demethoxyubiquinone hydroxylase family protein [Alphaproteobacteria bacterium]